MHMPVVDTRMMAFSRPILSRLVAISGATLAVTLIAGCKPAAPATPHVSASNPASPSAAQAAPSPASVPTPPPAPAAATIPTAMTPTVAQAMTDAQWRTTLSPEAFRVLRQKGTERTYTGEFWKTPASGGEYRCAACRALLFKGGDKFISDCGWPAFDKAIKGSIEYHMDRSYGMVRTEVVCANCKGHLGHVFEDGPEETTGVRYCINSVSITYTPDGSASKDMATEAIVDPTMPSKPTGK